MGIRLLNSPSGRTRPTITFGMVAAILALIGVNALAIDPLHEGRDDESAIRFVSEDRSVCIRSDFPSGRINQCVQIGDKEFDLVIRPEREPINDSAWYAFQLRATKPCTVNLRLRYEYGSHRYVPRISRDGQHWYSAGDLIVKQHPLGTHVDIRVDVGPEPLWISAQELLTNRVVDDWADALAKRPYITQNVIGRSVLDRPIRKLEITESDSPAYIFLMGRMHPPEVSGAIGMMRFVEAIAADTPLAKRFRQQFCAAVIPTVNPDGVARGHWRCNASGVDLNRDWGRFSQPETKSIAEELLAYRSRGAKSLYLVLDFHSTYEDVFYTPADVDDAFPKNFTSTWLKELQGRFPWYDVLLDATHNANRTTSKAWVHRTLDVAAVTYEFGDNTDRDLIELLARGNAEAMMQLLLERRQEHTRPTQLISVQSDL